MNLNELNINDSINLVDDSESTIISISKGWIGLSDGRKVRAKQIESVNEDPSDESDEDEEEISRMQKALDDHRPNYFKTVSAAGNTTFINGDDLSGMLNPMTPIEVADLADKVMGVEFGYHFDRYISLNQGQVRMNSGNRIRAALKRGDVTIEEIEKLVKS